MNERRLPKIVYVSFDELPGPKGACRHIEAFVRALGAQENSVRLITPGALDQGPFPFAPGVQHEILGCPDTNPLGRARTFRAKLRARLLTERYDIVHFRSIFEGITLVDPAVHKSAAIVYEVNGFPSIEMKYHYRSLVNDPYLTGKLAAQELQCLRAASHILTVSQVNRQAILARFTPTVPITVIPNGVDVDRYRFQTSARLAGADQPLRIGYVGTYTAWQGVEIALEALALVLRERSARLQLLGTSSKSRLQSLRQFAARIGVLEHVDFLPPGDVGAVLALLRQSHLTLVPLLAVDRNTQQGCCPLKMLEAMAVGCPIIASDLPVIREIATPWEHFLPTRPGDSRNLKNAILQLVSEPEQAACRAIAARDHVVRNLTWNHATDKLLAIYRSLFAVKS